MQECLTHWYFAKPKYDPQSKASPKTFMRNVIKHKLMDIVEKIYAKKRRAGYESVPFDETIAAEEGKVGSEDRPSEISLDSDIERVLAQLTPEQRAICRLIYEEGLTINEASKHFSMHRSNIYREVKKIREIFEKAGLKDYLKNI